MRRALRLLLPMMGLLALAQAANAACSNPTGNAGDMTYSTSANVMAYCDSTNWISMAGGVSLTVNTGGGGATPAGSTADVQYNSSGALAADTGNFTYASGVLKAPTISATYLNSQYGSVTTLYNPGTFSGNTASLNSVSSTAVSASTISATMIQIGSNGASCGSSISGAMRYTSGTMQVCDGSNWTNVGIGVPQGTISAFAATSCPSGWSEYTAARGRFLRGIDNGAGNDIDGTRSPGATQGDLIADHKHLQSVGTDNTYIYNYTDGSYVPAFGSMVLSGVARTVGGITTGTSQPVRIGYTSSTIYATGGGETRPKNVAVIFCQYQGYQSQLATGVATLASLSDVSVAGATSGSALVYNGSSWIAGTATGNAQGDRITSSTFSIIANPTAYASLSTNGTTWGYLGSAASYLPTLQTGTLNAGPVSATVVQTGTFSTACTSPIYGSMRWNATSDTIQICNTAGWTSLSSSSVPNTTLSQGTANYGAIFSGPNTLVTDSALYIDRTNHRVGIGTASPNSLLSLGGLTAQYPVALYIAPSGHATSRRTAITLDNWQILQDMAGNGTKDFGLYNAAAANYALSVDTTNNVSIGTTTPSTTLTVSSSTGLTVTNGAKAMILDMSGSGNDFRSVNAPLYINNVSTGASSTIINARSGNVFIGEASAWNVADGILRVKGVPGSSAALLVDGNTTANYVNIRFANNNGTVGSIVTNGTATAFNTSSDRRVKENIANTREGLSKLMDIRVRDFSFRKDPSHTTVNGFIAQELDKVYPEAVTTNGDNGEVPLKDTKDIWQVDYGRITPLIVKAVQDLKHLFDSDHEEVMKLKAANDNLTRRLDALEKSCAARR